MASSKTSAYDASPAEIRAFEEKSRMRALRKAEYNKMMADPYRWAFQAAPVDMGILRFEAQRTLTGQYRFFKPNPKTFAWYFFSVWAPVIAMTWFAEHERAKTEHKIRTGQVAYRDRDNIFA